MNIRLVEWLVGGISGRLDNTVGWVTGSMLDLVGNWKVGVICEHTKGTVIGD